MASEMSAPDGSSRIGGARMDVLLASIEREVLGWPGVWKKRDEDGPGGVASPDTGSAASRSGTSTTTATPTSGSREKPGTP